MKIYFVRHGEKEGDDFDSFMTGEGERQISLLVRRLKHEKISVSRIYTVNHESSIRAAEVLSKSLFVPAVRDDRFNEIGKNLFYENISENKDLFFTKMFTEEIISKNEDVLLVMPAGISRVAISHFTGLPLQEMIKFDLDFASLSLLESSDHLQKNFSSIKFINDTTHLKVP